MFTIINLFFQFFIKLNIYKINICYKEARNNNIDIIEFSGFASYNKLLEINGKLDYFPNDIRYKIYGFTPYENREENIKIFINRVNIDFDIYAFTDIFKFEIEQLHDLKIFEKKEQIKGYKYKSNTNNEIIIPKSDLGFNINKLIKLYAI